MRTPFLLQYRSGEHNADETLATWLALCTCRARFPSKPSNTPFTTHDMNFNRTFFHCLSHRRGCRWVSDVLMQKHNNNTMSEEVLKIANHKIFTCMPQQMHSPPALSDQVWLCYFDCLEWTLYFVSNSVKESETKEERELVLSFQDPCSVCRIAIAWASRKICIFPL